MKGVILAGGKGTRLRPLTCYTPKPLVHIMNRPIMEYCINWLKSLGITEIAITVCYLSEQIINYFGDGSRFGVKLFYFEDKTPLGTAGAVKNVTSFLDETFIVMSADAFTDADITEALKFHKTQNSSITILTKEVENPSEFGIVLTNNLGKVIDFVEKPAEHEIFSHCVNTGIYIVEPDLVNEIPPIIPFDFSQDLFPIMIEKNAELYAHTLNGYWRDIGKVDQYFQAHIDFLDHKVNVDVNAFEQSTSIWMGDQTSIHPSVQIEAPVYIGENCTIEAGVKLSAYTVIGDHSVIGAYSKMKGSIIWNRVQIGEEADLCEALIASDSFIGRNVSLHEHAVIGHGCIVEKNSCLQSGVKIGPNKRISSYASIQNTLEWDNSEQEPILKGGLHKGKYLTVITPDYLKKLAVVISSKISKHKHLFIKTDEHDLSSIYAKLFSESIHEAGVSTTILQSTPLTLFTSLIEHSPTFGGMMFQYLSSDKNPILFIRLLNDDGSDYSPEAIYQIERIVHEDIILPATFDKVYVNKVVGQISPKEPAISFHVTSDQQTTNFEQKIIQ